MKNLLKILFNNKRKTASEIEEDETATTESTESEASEQKDTVVIDEPKEIKDINVYAIEITPYGVRRHYK